jgi:ubiquinone/menaquinone biosynthesis C-methylase UbiE
MNLADPAFVKDQYRDGANLDARIALHERFSTSTRDWHAWLFDHFDLPDDARILEIGCGTGALWHKNRARVPTVWRLTLSDFSLGMVETARATGVSADLAQSDAQTLPFRAACFDAVIANHMLYHVPDLPRALREIRRMLKPGGKLYAATNGIAHMREYFQLVSNFLGSEPSVPLTQFTLENGADQLVKHFARVERFDFDSHLEVTEVEPLVAYAMSGFTGKQLIGNRRVETLRRYVAERIARDGVFHITKAAGLFVARAG